MTTRDDARANEAIAALHSSGGLEYTPDHDDEGRPAVHPLTEFGALLTVGPGSPATVSTPPQNFDTNWTIEMQVKTFPPGISATSPFATDIYVATVTYTIGSATFTKYVLLLGKVVRRLPLTARQVTVTVSVTNASFSLAELPVGQGQVAVGISHGNGAKNPIEQYAPYWNNCAAGSTAGALYMTSTSPQSVPLVTPQGLLLAARVSVVTMPTGAGSSGFFVMLFDSSTQPNNLAVPIWVSKPLTAVNDWDAWDDEFAPSVEWDSGSLWIGASSTAGTYAACGSAPSFRADFKMGN